MSVKPFLSLDKLVAYLDEEVNSQLALHSLHDIRNIGWVSDEEPDPELIGHAMWQLDPPMHRLANAEESLGVVGTDFEGLMIASRLSLGLCLLHQPLAANVAFGDSHFFWLHQISTALHLNMASDRLRKYFLAAFLKTTPKKYDRKKKREIDWQREKKAKLYALPFLEIVADWKTRFCAPEKAIAAVAVLPDLASKVSEYRDMRNEAVHEIATCLAKRELERVRKRGGAINANNGAGHTDDAWSTIDPEVRLAEVLGERRNELVTATSDLIDWYRTLEAMSSRVFEAEYWLRVGSAVAKA